MPDTPVYDFPFPSPTDLVREAPQFFEDLADKVEETLLAFPTYGEAVHDYGTVDTATNIDLELGPVQTIVVDDDLTLTVTGAPTAAGVARSVLLLVKQGTGGSYGVTLAGVDWFFGLDVPPALAAGEEFAVTIVATSVEVRAFIVSQAV
jgi:hypothetical protein